MALFPKTPGVYIEEIPRFPSSVAAVPTSVPVFIGYTAKAEKNGDLDALLNTPVRIESLLEFETIFGGAFQESFIATLAGPSIDIAVAKIELGVEKFRLYYHMLMYFGNGGGPCYIISVGDYGDLIADGPIIDGINKAEQVDEITMVVVPESIALSQSDRRDVYNAMLAHSAKMQDRFAIMDVEVITTGVNTIQNDADEFRDDTIGANNLSYGAAYYPSFKPSFPFSYLDTAVTITAIAPNLPLIIQAFNTKSLAVVNNGIVRKVTLTVNSPTIAANLEVTVSGFPMQSIAVPVAGPNQADAVALAGLINANTIINPHLTAIPPTGTSTVVTVIATSASTASNLISIVSTVPARLTMAPVDSGLTPDKILYNRIKSLVDDVAIELYPSAMMAGIYCAVDTSRGVWKAPANVGITLVDKLNRNVKDSNQENLNVDPTSGKSIDVIREFPGRGLLVWGARTLDGNSNEWRYINVRRTFLFIEDSCKKATMFSVFEPNDMNTWLRIKGMISSFLNTMWRDGALAGGKPEQAFFVKVGLGETMTSQDILEGRLIVQIGLAVVRPAEFIILQFEHKLQVS